MEVRKIRAEMRQGRSIFDLPLRVTFYARVSTEKCEQLNSLENQIQYYTELIESQANWTYVEGYVDEGISGTSTKKRDRFNRMIADAKAGRFDFIITKEISRFSRSTLDSIRYTQELLEHGVGVLFQNDNINTLDSDSEFRLVVMAGVAQDEVRKLSERLQFGFRQSIRNGRVLGNDKIWGYDKKDCQLTVNEEEAEVVRLIFDLYAQQGLGLRRLSRTLYNMGHTSRKGNEFNVLTIRHILTNPKYKGWYCGHKTQSLDYRSKKTACLDESEWITYPDPNVPAIVSEALWDRANALYKSRGAQMRSHQSAATFHNRYAYSGKLICEEHKTGFHRRVLKSAGGSKEVWQCRVYRQRGRAACAAPQLRTAELDEIMAKIFTGLIRDPKAIVDALAAVIRNVSDERGCERDTAKLEAEMTRIQAKKERLLEMSVADALSISEFKSRNDSCNKQLFATKKKLDALQAERTKSAATENPASIKAALQRELNFADGIHSELVVSILDRIVVKKDSTKEDIHLEIHLKCGHPRDVRFRREKSSLRLMCF
ncbi:MAG: recombinase family protein [Oscillospiraceae bacterium]|jgi:DNA invertase Pin-like site-specific DNA recombinase|nr:recombinase family protein [Oscillospiraceae bacterium]